MPVSTMLMSSLLSGATSGGGGGGQGLANIAGGLVSGVTGFFQRRKAKKELEKLKRPEYSIPNEILQNQKKAEMAANEGLPSQQYNQAMQNIQRQQNRALVGAGGRRSALMALPGIQQQANDQLLNLDVKDAQARMTNQQQLYGINSQVAGYRDKEFNINKMQPYQDNLQYYRSLLGAGNQNLVGGIDKIASGGALLLGGGMGGGKSSKAGSKGGVSSPIYSGGYDANSDYGTIENPFE